MSAPPPGDVTPFTAAVLGNAEARGRRSKMTTLGDFMTTYDYMRFVDNAVLRQDSGECAGANNGHHHPQPIPSTPVLEPANQWPALVHGGPVRPPTTHRSQLHARITAHGTQQHALHKTCQNPQSVSTPAKGRSVEKVCTGGAQCTKETFVHDGHDAHTRTAMHSLYGEHARTPACTDALMSAESSYPLTDHTARPDDMRRNGLASELSKHMISRESPGSCKCTPKRVHWSDMSEDDEMTHQYDPQHHTHQQTSSHVSERRRIGLSQEVIQAHFDIIDEIRGVTYTEDAVYETSDDEDDASHAEQHDTIRGTESSERYDDYTPERRATGPTEQKLQVYDDTNTSSTPTHHKCEDTENDVIYTNDYMTFLKRLQTDAPSVADVCATDARLLHALWERARGGNSGTYAATDAMSTYDLATNDSHGQIHTRRSVNEDTIRANTSTLEQGAYIRNERARSARKSRRVRRRAETLQESAQVRVNAPIRTSDSYTFIRNYTTTTHTASATHVVRSKPLARCPNYPRRTTRARATHTPRHVRRARWPSLRGDAPSLPSVRSCSYVASRPCTLVPKQCVERRSDDETLRVVLRAIAYILDENPVERHEGEGRGGGEGAPKPDVQVPTEGDDENNAKSKDVKIHVEPAPRTTSAPISDKTCQASNPPSPITRIAIACTQPPHISLAPQPLADVTHLDWPPSPPPSPSAPYCTTSHDSSPMNEIEDAWDVARDVRGVFDSVRRAVRRSNLALIADTIDEVWTEALTVMREMEDSMSASVSRRVRHTSPPPTPPTQTDEASSSTQMPDHRHMYHTTHDGMIIRRRRSKPPHEAQLLESDEYKERYCHEICYRCGLMQPLHSDDGTPDNRTCYIYWRTDEQGRRWARRTHTHTLCHECHKRVLMRAPPDSTDACAICDDTKCRRCGMSVISSLALTMCECDDDDVLSAPPSPPIDPTTTNSDFSPLSESDLPLDVDGGQPRVSHDIAPPTTPTRDAPSTSRDDDAPPTRDGQSIAHENLLHDFVVNERGLVMRRRGAQRPRRAIAVEEEELESLERMERCSRCMRAQSVTPPSVGAPGWPRFPCRWTCETFWYTDEEGRHWGKITHRHMLCSRCYDHYITHAVPGTDVACVVCELTTCRVCGGHFGPRIRPRACLCDQTILHVPSAPPSPPTSPVSPPACDDEREAMMRSNRLDRVSVEGAWRARGGSVEGACSLGSAPSPPPSPPLSPVPFPTLNEGLSYETSVDTHECDDYDDSRESLAETIESATMGHEESAASSVELEPLGQMEECNRCHATSAVAPQSAHGLAWSRFPCHWQCENHTYADDEGRPYGRITHDHALCGRCYGHYLTHLQPGVDEICVVCNRTECTKCGGHFGSVLRPAACRCDRPLSTPHSAPPSPPTSPTPFAARDDYVAIASVTASRPIPLSAPSSHTTPDDTAETTMSMTNEYGVQGQSHDEGRTCCSSLTASVGSTRHATTSRHGEASRRWHESSRVHTPASGMGAERFQVSSEAEPLTPSLRGELPPSRSSPEAGECTADSLHDHSSSSMAISEIVAARTPNLAEIVHAVNAGGESPLLPWTLVEIGWESEGCSFVRPAQSAMISRTRAEALVTQGYFIRSTGYAVCDLCATAYPSESNVVSYHDCEHVERRRHTLCSFCLRTITTETGEAGLSGDCHPCRHGAHPRTLIAVNARLERWSAVELQGEDEVVYVTCRDTTQDEVRHIMTEGPSRNRIHLDAGQLAFLSRAIGPEVVCRIVETARLYGREGADLLISCEDLTGIGFYYVEMSLDRPSRVYYSQRCDACHRACDALAHGWVRRNCTAFDDTCCPSHVICPACVTLYGAVLGSDAYSACLICKPPSCPVCGSEGWLHHTCSPRSRVEGRSEGGEHGPETNITSSRAQYTPPSSPPNDGHAPHWPVTIVEREDEGRDVDALYEPTPSLSEHITFEYLCGAITSWGRDILSALTEGGYDGHSRPCARSQRDVLDERSILTSGWEESEENCRPASSGKNVLGRNHRTASLCEKIWGRGKGLLSSLITGEVDGRAREHSGGYFDVTPPASPPEESGAAHRRSTVTLSDPDPTHAECEEESIHVTPRVREQFRAPRRVGVDRVGPPPILTLTQPPSVTTPGAHKVHTTLPTPPEEPLVCNITYGRLSSLPTATRDNWMLIHEIGQTSYIRLDGTSPLNTPFQCGNNGRDRSYVDRCVDAYELLLRAGDSRTLRDICDDVGLPHGLVRAGHGVDLRSEASARSNTIYSLAQLAIRLHSEGKEMTLLCHCHPIRCHAESVRSRIRLAALAICKPETYVYDRTTNSLRTAVNPAQPHKVEVHVVDLGSPTQPVGGPVKRPHSQPATSSAKDAHTSSEHAVGGNSHDRQPGAKWRDYPLLRDEPAKRGEPTVSEVGSCALRQGYKSLLALVTFSSDKIPAIQHQPHSCEDSTAHPRVGSGKRRFYAVPNGREGPAIYYDDDTARPFYQRLPSNGGVRHYSSRGEARAAIVEYYATLPRHQIPRSLCITCLLHHLPNPCPWEKPRESDGSGAAKAKEPRSCEHLASSMSARGVEMAAQSSVGHDTTRPSVQSRSQRTDPPDSVMRETLQNVGEGDSSDSASTGGGDDHDHATSESRWDDLDDEILTLTLSLAEALAEEPLVRILDIEARQGSWWDCTAPQCKVSSVGDTVLPRPPPMLSSHISLLLPPITPSIRAFAESVNDTEGGRIWVTSGGVWRYPGPSGRIITEWEGRSLPSALGYVGPLTLDCEKLARVQRTYDTNRRLVREESSESEGELGADAIREGLAADAYRQFVRETGVTRLHDAHPGPHPPSPLPSPPGEASEGAQMTPNQALMYGDPTRYAEHLVSQLSVELTPPSARRNHTQHDDVWSESHPLQPDPVTAARLQSDVLARQGIHCPFCNNGRMFPDPTILGKHIRDSHEPCNELDRGRLDAVLLVFKFHRCPSCGGPFRNKSRAHLDACAAACGHARGSPRRASPPDQGEESPLSLSQQSILYSQSQSSAGSPDQTDGDAETSTQPDSAQGSITVSQNPSSPEERWLAFLSDIPLVTDSRYAEVMGRTMMRIPEVAYTVLRKAVSVPLRLLCNSIDNEGAWKLLLLLPRLLFKRLSDKLNTVTIRTILEGRATSIVEGAPDKVFYSEDWTVPKKVAQLDYTDAQIATRMHEEIKLGKPSKAMAYLADGGGLCEGTSDCENDLRKLCPEGENGQFRDHIFTELADEILPKGPFNSPVIHDSDRAREVVTRWQAEVEGKSDGSGAACDGLRPAHLKMLIREYPAEVSYVLEAIYTYKIPAIVRRHLAVARLFAVWKPHPPDAPPRRPTDKRGRRPIGCRSHWTRIPSSLFARKQVQKHKGMLLSAGQCGSGVTAGGEAAARAMQLSFDYDPKEPIGKGDISKAFQTLSRVVIIETLSGDESFAELLKYFVAYYEIPVLQWTVINGKLTAIMSYQGGGQGDGPFAVIFDVVFTVRVIKPITADYPSAKIVGIHDDLYIKDTLENLARIIPLRDTLSLRAGMAGNLSKNAIVQSDRVRDTEDDIARHKDLFPDGIIYNVLDRDEKGEVIETGVPLGHIFISGVPVGNYAGEHSVAHAVEAKGREVIAILNKLSTTPLRAQDKAILLAYCAKPSSRLNLIYRGVPTCVTSAIACQVDTAFSRTVCENARVDHNLLTPDNPLKIRQQLDLPVAWGGAGYPRLSVYGGIMHMSSMADTLPTVASLLPDLEILRHPERWSETDNVALKEAARVFAEVTAYPTSLTYPTNDRSGLKAFVGKLCGETGGPDIANLALVSGKKPQHHFGGMEAKWKWRAMVDDSQSPRHLRARIQAAASTGAGAWLQVMTPRDATLLNDTAWILAFRHRFGVPHSFILDETRCSPTCRKYKNGGLCEYERETAAHFFHCGAGPFRLRRHNSVVDVLGSFLKEMKFDVRERRLTIHNTNSKKVDLIAQRADATARPLCIDVTVVCHLAQSRVSKAANSLDLFMKEAEEAKRKKHEAAAANHDMDFLPAVFNTTGGMGRELSQFLEGFFDKERAQEMLRSGDDVAWDTESARLKLHGNLSAAIQRTNAAMIIGLSRKHGGFAATSLLDPGMLSKRGGAALRGLGRQEPFQGHAGGAVTAVAQDVLSDDRDSDGSDDDCAMGEADSAQ